MKKVDNSLHSEDIELPVIYTISKYKTKNGAPVIDPETNQPIVVATKEIDVKYTFRKYNITVKSQSFKNNKSQVDAKVSEIFEV